MKNAFDPERVGDDERPRLRPPERRLAPALPSQDRDERERAVRDLVGRDEVRDAEPRRERRAVAIVAVEELDHARGLAEAERSLDRVGPVERVDEPDLPVGGERMRGARHRLVDDPAEAVGAAVVAEPELHR